MILMKVFLVMMMKKRRGEESELYLDNDLLSDYFLEEYNPDNILDEIKWKEPETPIGLFENRSYFQTKPYLSEGFGINSHLLHTGSIMYPDEPESWVLKYETWHDDFDPLLLGGTSSV
jgi:hypothetical protein